MLFALLLLGACTVASGGQTCPLGEEACAVHAPLFAQIDADLAWWKAEGASTGVTQASHVAAMSEKLGDQQPPLIQIVGNKIYCARYAAARYDDANYPEHGSNCFPDDEDKSRLLSVFLLLHRMLQKYKVPDVQFFFSTCDSSLVHAANGATKSHLLISEAKTKAFRDVLAPGHSFVAANEQGHTQWERWMEPRWQAELAAAFPWERKLEVGFWRGINADTNEVDGETGHMVGGMSHHRKRLVDATLAQGDAADHRLLDARFVADFDAAADRSQLANFTSMRDHGAYKYLLHIDGATYSSRYMKLLLLNSVVLKQVSGWHEYFEAAMRPYREFLPFDRHSTENVTAQVRWAIANDGEARKIGERGNAFARKHLSIGGAECYWWRLLTEYATIFEGGIALADDAQPFVPPPPPIKAVDGAKFRAALTKFYTKHDPKKATDANISLLVKDFRGKEKSLAKALAAKYSEAPFEVDDIRED